MLWGLQLGLVEKVWLKPAALAMIASTTRRLPAEHLVLAFLPEERWIATMCALRRTCRAARRGAAPPMPQLVWEHAAGRALTSTLCTAAVLWLSARAHALCLRLHECMPRAEEFTILTECPRLRELMCMGTLLSDETLARAFACQKPALRRFVLSHCSESVTRRCIAYIDERCPVLKHLRISHVEVEQDFSLLRAAAARTANAQPGFAVRLLEIVQPGDLPGAAPDYCIIYAAGPPRQTPVENHMHVLAPVFGVDVLEVTSRCWPKGSPKGHGELLRLPARDARRTELREAENATDALRSLHCGSVFVASLRVLYSDHGFNLLRVCPDRGIARASQQLRWRRCEARWAKR